MQKGWSVQKTTLSFSLWPVSAQNLQQKDGYLSQNDFGSRFSAIACRFFLVPMAHFGIESIAKKDGYPSQNDFALFALWLVFGIEGLMQKGWSVQKMTLSFSQWPVSAQNLQRKGRIPSSKRLRVPLQRDSVSALRKVSVLPKLNVIGRNEPLLYLRVSIVYMDRSMHRFLRRSCIF